ncbi:biopolymer transporter ExbD [filamentous cyanobacterium LEGE 11480]|uniref:Biopolymer transporter ExbD n=2 Tax=Romeriopsis TaxID=2992131 RepID=A0A928VM44_9CYAN|nr:biopolymer transporter ExbD [Romeriopsis navalis LEGE 11480]
MPEVNLIPMIDVIMTILTFFIIMSMTLSNFQSVDIRLPGKGDGKGNSAQSNPVQPLLVGLNVQGQIVLESGIADRPQMIQKVQTYLMQNPQGVVVLNADKDVPYENVVQLLGVLRDLGGDRVSLAIQ